MDKINQTVEEMQEYICDKICRHPFEASQEELDTICAECKIEKHIKDIIGGLENAN